MCYNYMLKLQFFSYYQFEELQMSSSAVCTVAVLAHSSAAMLETNGFLQLTAMIWLKV